jgi:site-specific recombinase XerD
LVFLFVFPHFSGEKQAENRQNRETGKLSGKFRGDTGGRVVGRVLSAGYAELWEEFLAYKERRVSVRGFAAVKAASFSLLKWLEERDVRPEEATVRDALEYKAFVAGRVTKAGLPVTAGTCRNALKAGRVFFGYLVAGGRRDGNPFRAVAYPRLAERINRNVLSEARTNALLERLRRFTDAGSYKAHVVAELLYASGLRIAEAASLIPRDIDTRQRLVYVREGKGGKSRTAFLTGYAAEVLERYVRRGRALTLRSYHGPRPQGHTLFCVGHARLLQEINGALRTACTELELPVITSHGFRHSVGTHLLRAGCDMRHIQVILGHDKLETTQIYTHLDKDDVKASLDAHHPRRWGGAGRP